MRIENLPEYAEYLAIALIVVSLTVGPVYASPDPGPNYTVQPASDYDHRPGIDDASYKAWTTTGSMELSVERMSLKYIVVEWEAGRLGECGPGGLEKAGIDRDNDDPGTHIDESIVDNVKNNYHSEDREVFEFIDRDDPFGEPVTLNVDDEIISYVTDCRGNPDEPGWYRMGGEVNGTTEDGERVGFTAASSYFYICRCDSYDEAREQLGPSPAERTPTPTEPPATRSTASTESPTARSTTPTDTSRTSHPTETPVASDAPGTETAVTAADTETVTVIPERDPAPSTDTPTATDAEWARNTPANGPGFSAIAALAGVVALVALRYHTDERR